MTVTLRRVVGGLEMVIPDELAAQVGLCDGTPVSLNVEHGRMVAELASPVLPSYRLDVLIAGITDDNVHGETDLGSSVGNEVW